MGALDPVSGSAPEVLAALQEWDAAADPPALSVATSGSTGRPKHVVLSRAAMRASADATHARLGGPGRWQLCLPPTYVAGLQVLFRSVRAGTEPTLGGLDELDRPGWSGDVGEATPSGGVPRYVSVVPTQLHRLLADPGTAGELARFDTVLVGGAALDPRLRLRAADAGVRLVTTYGMAETCGGCVYDGRPLDRVEVAVGDGGRVRVRGPVLFDGYRDEPQLTREVLDEGWFTTQDRGRLDGTGRLVLEGRVDDVVVSGGVNVPTGAVAAHLRRHPAVHDAEVVGVPDDEWGQVVVAVAVTDADLGQLREHVAQAYPRSHAPRRLVRVDALPLLANGKLDRLEVLRLAL